MLPVIVAFIATIVLILVNGVFVSAEFAIVRIRRTRLEELAGHGIAAAKRAILIVDHVNEYLATTQIAVTAASLGVGWLGERSFASLLERLLAVSTVTAHVASTALAFLLITSIHVVVGELVPKNLAITHAERLLLALTGPLEVIHYVLKPLRRLLAWSSSGILRALGQGRPGGAPALSEGEIKLILEDSHEEGVVTDSEARIIVRAFEFSDKRAVEIMVPAEDVHYFSLARSLDRNLELARTYPHARFPLCRDDLDSVIGVVGMKDLWPRLVDGASNSAMQESARSAVRVAFDAPQDAILLRLQQGRSQLAVVRDAADRHTLGIVTLEDVIESLVGDVREPKLHELKR